MHPKRRPQQDRAPRGLGARSGEGPARLHREGLAAGAGPSTSTSHRASAPDGISRGPQHAAVLHRRGRRLHLRVPSANAGVGVGNLAVVDGDGRPVGYTIRKGLLSAQEVWLWLRGFGDLVEIRSPEPPR